MRLPNALQAEVPHTKIAEYLLAPWHPRGRSKAAFFLGRGFRREQPESLRAALVRHALEHDIVEQRPTRFGVSFRVDGPMEMPDGSVFGVRTVWFIEHGEARPRLATAYPLRKP